MSFGPEPVPLPVPVCSVDVTFSTFPPGPNLVLDNGAHLLTRLNSTQSLLIKDLFQRSLKAKLLSYLLGFSRSY